MNRNLPPGPQFIYSLRHVTRWDFLLVLQMLNGLLSGME